jgi:hypothetical protein
VHNMLILHELADSPTLSSHSLHQWPPPAFGCETAVCCTHDSKHLGRGKSCTPEALILNVQVFPLVEGPHLGKSLFQEKTTMLHRYLLNAALKGKDWDVPQQEFRPPERVLETPYLKLGCLLMCTGVSTIVSVMNKAISTGPRERH